MSAQSLPLDSPKCRSPSIDIRHGDYRDVLRDVRVDLIFTSPPYNIGSRAPRQDGFRAAGKYDPKSYGAIRDYPDSLPEEVYQDQQAAFLIWCADHLVNDGVLVYNHKPRRNGRMIHPAEWFLQPAVRQRMTLMEEVIWDRGSTHNHAPALMWPTTERLYVFRRADGEYRFRNYDGLPQRSDVWRIGLNSRGTNGHACPFSIRLAEAVISAWSKPSDLVCDPYLGSGTTALAAIGLGRRFVGAELMEKYWRMAERAVLGDPLERVA